MIQTRNEEARFERLIIDILCQLLIYESADRRTK